jgi:hypothetical protein
MKNTSNSFAAETHVPLCPSLFTLTDISPTNPTANGTLYRIDNGSKGVAKKGTKIHNTEFNSFGTNRYRLILYKEIGVFLMLMGPCIVIIF